MTPPTAEEIEASLNPFGWVNHVKDCDVCSEMAENIHCALGLQLRIAAYRAGGIKPLPTWYALGSSPVGVPPKG